MKQILNKILKHKKARRINPGLMCFKVKYDSTLPHYYRYLML